MRIPSLFYRSAIVAGLAVLASCGSDSATSPTTSAATSLTAAISQTSVVDANTFASGRTLASQSNTTANATPTFDPAACAFSATDNSFTCPSKTASGLTFQLKYFLYNSSGVAMTAYDAASTAAVRTVWDASGTFSTTGANASALQWTHHSDLTLNGLLSTSRTLSGSSTDHGVFDTGSGASAVHAVLDAAGSATSVVLPATTGAYPSSGLLATDITASTTSNGFSTTATARGTLAFNGTNFALLTLTSGAGTKACTIDLSGATAPRC
ncbi:MAG TPA: hypothetical protein VGM82_11845 [Gemmatimonadaceae bacterium]|jgi:hypothetical protein